MVSTRDRQALNDWNAPVPRALAGSVVFHLLLLLLLEAGGRRGWWQHAWTLPGSRSVATVAPSEIEVEIVQVPPATEPALTFIEVPKSQATAETPPDAKFYSALNSKAANPGPTRDSDVPEIKGTQEDVARTVDSVAERIPSSTTPPVPLAPPAKETEAQPLQPAPSVPKPLAVREQPPEQPNETESPLKEPGDLAMLKPPRPGPVVIEPVEPEPIPKPAEEPPPAPPRRRTLDQFLMAANPAVTPGEKMRQSGGARRNATEASFDVKATEFGAYDAAIIAAISKRWYDLLDERYVSPLERGKVVLEFRLTSEGEITNMREAESSVSPELGLICQRAVMEPARYASWPRALRAIVGKDYRQVKFTFHYR